MRDFGARGDGAADDRPALQAALDAAAAAGVPAAVRLEASRTYRLGTNASSVAALTLRGATNVALEGCGATLLAHPASRTLTVFASQDIALRNLVFDFDPLPFTQGRILALHEGGLRFAVDPGYPAPVAAAGERYKDHKASDCVFIDGATRLFNHEWRRIRSVAPIASNVYDVLFYGAGAFKATRAGDSIAVKVLQPEAPLPRAPGGRYVATGSANIQIRFSERVRLENVTSYAAPGMTLCSSGSEDVSADGLRIVRKPGTDRLVAGCSDGAHMKSLTLMPRFINCTFEALMDDAINIKISANKVAQLDGCSAALAHADIAWDDIVVKPGDVVEWVNAEETAFLGLSRARTVRRDAYRRARVMFDSIPPAVKVGDLAFLRPRAPALVSNCTFRTQLKTALLTRPPTLVADCRFEDVAYGVHAMLGSDGIEGPAPRDIEVRRCSFSHPWVAGVALSVKAFGVVPTDVGGVRLSDCAFTLSGSGRAVSGRIPELALTNLAICGESARGQAVAVKTRASAEAQAVAACLARIRACQLPDGAFAQVEPRNPGSPVWTAPYFANTAALALLACHAREPNPDDVARVGRWLAWCAAHQAPDGCWHDFEGTAAACLDTGKVDAWDSSAALFLLTAERHRRAGGAAAPEVLDAARRALACIRRVTDADGLTWAKPECRMKYLMDNVEVHAGLRAAATLFASAGQAEEATQAAAQAGRIASRLPDFWQPAEGCFAYVLQADGTYQGGLDRPYPHRLAQLYGIAFVDARPEAWARIAGDFEPDASPAAPCGAAWWLAAAARLSAPDLQVWRDRVVAEAAAFSPQRTYLNRYALAALALSEGASWLCQDDRFALERGPASVYAREQN